ncbi:MAG: GspH/FimT family protein [Candidatus Melainabacteria bacterium]|nr:GspH/FimT family protein [Candidatus Melainabacteria bacterium]
MSDSDPKPERDGAKLLGFEMSWAKVRKFEALVFFAMFGAVPLFAFRVVSYTQSQLLVRNATHELVQDLHNAKETAVRTGKEVTLKAVHPQTGMFSPSDSRAPYRYLIKSETRANEEVVLPPGLSLTGMVTFSPLGRPLRPSTFIFSVDNRTSTIEIDKEGMVSVP